MQSGRSDLSLPPHARGMRIALFGGSFNPAHGGHVLASVNALRRLGLDAVWWLVTPGNPLKDNRALPPLAERIAAARRLIGRNPAIHVTGVEATLGTRFTADTLAALRRRCAGVRFVWLMGADNLRDFHRWRGWRDIAAMMPIAVVDRPGSTHRAVRARAAVALADRRLDESDGVLLATETPPAWLFIHGRRSMLSSTALRAGRDARAGPAVRSS